MKKKKFCLTDAEWRVILDSLNTLRNKLISEGRYTDAVDDALLAVSKAKIKKVKTP